MARTKIYSNLNSLTAATVHDGGSAEYRFYRQCWQDYPARFILRDFPLHLDIEATSRCNLKCVFCDRQPYLAKDQLGDMDLAFYKRIIDEGAGHKLWAVKLSYRGEPLLHKDIFKMVSYAKKKGILDVYFNTNATLMDKEAACKIIDSGLDRISISIEGTSAPEYEKLRVNAKFNTVFKNIKQLVELKKKMRLNLPKIRIQSVDYPGFNADKYRIFWADYADEVALLDFTDMSQAPDTLPVKWSCPQLWQRMTIEWDGTVFACNNDKLRKLAAGNLKNQSVYECWHGQSADKIRNLHSLGHFRKVQSCNECPWRMAQIGKDEDY